MLNPRLLPAAGALVLALLPPAGAAQVIDSPYRHIERGQEAGFFLGSFGAEVGRFGFGPKGSELSEGRLLFGLRYSIELGGPIAIEGTVSALPTERDVVDPNRPEGDRVLEDPAEVTLTLIDARLRFNLTGRRTWNRIQPFLVAGGGLGFDAQGAQAEDQEVAPDERFDFGTAFHGLIGAGGRVFLGDRFVVRGEASIILYKIDTPEGWGDPDLELDVVPEAEWVNAGTFTVGLAYAF